MVNAPDSLVWACVRNNNSFLVKKNGHTKRSGSVHFSTEKGNLRSISSYKYSGLANSKTIDISCTEDNRAMLSTKTRKASSYPVKGQTKIPINKDYRRVEKAILSQTVNNYYRRDLKGDALAKWSTVYRANRIAKNIKKKKEVKKGVLRAGEEAEVLSLLARHPAVSAQRGNPRRLIEVACRVSPTLRNLSDLVPPIMASAVMSDQAQSSDAGASAADAIQAHCASDETHRPRQATVLGSCRSSSVTAHPLGTPPILFKAVQVSGAGAVPD